MKLSDSLRSAQRDEFVYVSVRGEVRPAWRFTLGRRLSVATAISIGGAGVALSVVAGTPLLAIPYILTLGYIGLVWRHGQKLKRGVAFLAADELGAAEGEFRAVLQSATASKTLKAITLQNMSGLEARRGNHATALLYARECRAVLGRSWFSAGPWRWINRFNEALLLAQLGRIEEAKVARQELASAPDGEYFEILSMNVDLMLAFAQGSAAGLPEDLHPWVRTTLDTTSAELALALLTWAHYARDDADMGAHLLLQARERIDPVLFGNVYPAVLEWLMSRPTIEPSLADDR